MVISIMSNIEPLLTGYYNIGMKKWQQGRIKMKNREISKEKGPLGWICNDPMGSYTGVPADPMEKPVQDADDL